MVESSAPYTNIKICTHKHWGKNQRVEGLMTKKKRRTKRKKRGMEKKGENTFLVFFNRFM